MRASAFSAFTLLALGSLVACGSTDDLAGPSKPATRTDAGTDAPNDTSSAADGFESDSADDVTQPDGATPDATLPSCEAPTDPTTAALCLVFEPEVLDLVDGDERFDGQGIFIVQVFETSEIELPDGSELPALAETMIPEQTGGATPVLTSVYDPLDPIRFEGLPSTVYVRVLFVDNFDVFESDSLVGGVFVGGLDLSQGVYFEGLEPVDLTVGEGFEVTMPLVTLRSMKVTLTKPLLTLPYGNGEGPAGFLLFDTSTITNNLSVWGVGETECGSIHSGIDVEGAFVGEGPYFGFGFMDDYGEGLDDSIPSGTVVNLNLDDLSLPSEAEISIPAGAYRVEASLELTDIVSFQSFPPTDSVSCE